MISIEDVTKNYRIGCGVNALNGISLDISDGEMIIIMGKSGSGKSTLLHMLGGLDKPTSGSIKYDGNDITKLSENALSVFRRDNIGYVFQDYNLIPELNAEENIKYPVYLAGKKIDHERWNFLVETLDISDRLSHLPNQLSGGQQQRVAIARALLSNPSVVLCDEPTGNLDSAAAESVRDMLFRMNNELHKTIVVVTHDGEFASSGGRVIRLRDGKIGGNDETDNTIRS